MTLAQLQTLLEIMLHDDIPSMTEIASKTNQPLVTVSRHVGIFGPVRNQFPTALGLLTTERDIEDQRKTILKLTTKGKLLAKELRQLVT